MVFGILNLIFTFIGCCGTAISAPMMFGAKAANNPFFTMMQASPGYLLWLKVSVVLGGVTLLMLLAAGIGLLMMQAWGRWLSIAYAVVASVIGVVNIAMSAVFLLPPALAQAGQQSSPESAGLLIGAIGGTVGGCFGLLYPLILLIFMFRPSVAAAFGPETDGITPSLPGAQPPAGPLG